MAKYIRIYSSVHGGYRLYVDSPSLSGAAASVPAPPVSKRFETIPDAARGAREQGDIPWSNVSVPRQIKYY